MPTATHEQLAEWEACLEHDGKLPANAAPALIATIREQGEVIERMVGLLERLHRAAEAFAVTPSPSVTTINEYYAAIREAKRAVLPVRLAKSLQETPEEWT